MHEQLLSYIWRFQYYNNQSITLSDGSTVQVISPGRINTNQGPDFLEARIKIGETLFFGNVELHVLASDWNRHNHQDDPNYKNVILHVVWKNDQPANLLNLPALELEGRVSHSLVSRYNLWMQSRTTIPCASQVGKIGSSVWYSWKNHLLIDRLIRKSSHVLKILEDTNHHWEQSFWIYLARVFGGRVNAGAFEQIARSIPFNCLAKHRQQVIQIEAFLFGQAGLLNKQFEEQYAVLLQKEYQFLLKKYKLQPIQEKLQFLRMRPSEFPSVKLAQLAMLYSQSSQLLSTILECSEVSEVVSLLDVTANDYWHYHYLPDQLSEYNPKRLGRTSINNLLINAVIPSVFAYAKHTSNKQLVQRAISWLHKVPAEKNNVVSDFKDLDFLVADAADSQAILELNNEWCSHKRCLACPIGSGILKSEIRVTQ